MSKRARGGGSVTGGTGDVKPQILTISSGQATAADDYVTDRLPLPVPRFGTMKSKATILEFLWVDWYIDIRDIGDTTSISWAFLSTTALRTDDETSTLATLNEDVLDPRTFALALLNRNFTTSGLSQFYMPFHIDLTDNNGNGILVATDSIVITHGNVNGTLAGSAIAKIGYRLVNVGITEYVGIVQSQQAT